MPVKELRCEHPHPKIPGRECRAIFRVRELEGKMEVECYRCHGWVKFAACGSESPVLTGSIA